MMTDPVLWVAAAAVLMIVTLLTGMWMGYGRGWDHAEAELEMRYLEKLARGRPREPRRELAPFPEPGPSVQILVDDTSTDLVPALPASIETELIITGWAAEMDRFLAGLTEEQEQETQ
jgi:hypothetical protein